MLTESKNSVVVNFGSGTVTSLEYERCLLERKNQFVIASAGVGAGMEGKVYTLSEVENPNWYLVFPHKLAYSIGSNNNYLEIGIGGLFVQGNTTQPYLAYPTLGYRFIGNNKTTFKFYLSWPLSGIETNDLGFVPVGLSLGQFF